MFDYSAELEHTMGNNFKLSVVPGMINIGAIYLLHISMAASMGLFYGGLAVGFCNSIAPLVKHQSAGAGDDEPSVTTQPAIGRKCAP